MYGLWDDFAVLADLFGAEEAARVGHSSERGALRVGFGGHPARIGPRTPR
jgi:hypothetical protein